MGEKRISITVFLWLITGFVFSQTTEIKYLSGTDASNPVLWDFYCTEGRNSGKWTTIPVPSNWELQGFGNYNYGVDWNNKNRTIGKEHGLYKHEFSVPAGWKGKQVNIVFEGSMTDTQVKINGKPAGDVHQGAFYRFQYDISKMLRYGKTNLLEVDVAEHSANQSVNRAEREGDFWIFGGIFRPVYLEVLPKFHIQRAAIDAQADGSFQAYVFLSEAKTGYSVSAELFDMKGNPIEGTVETKVLDGGKRCLIKGRFENIKSWNPEWPNLYEMTFKLKKESRPVHETTKRIGFRTVELRKHDGFYVNGEKVVFKGVNRHSFWPETGRSLSEEHHRSDIRLIREMNMNAVRTSHYLPDGRFLELCDSLGLFVLDEVMGIQQPYDTIVGPKLIREAILRDENHPCVVAWDHGNEGGWNWENEKWFAVYDFQKRPVFNPWLFHNGMDTHHYPAFDYGVGRFLNGNDPFMATELLHGLYDGGSGAGLEDYWRNYETSPLHAGGFLWALFDEAVLRTDKEGKVYDSDGNHAPDGILGPHREKEASFYTIKEIWSPVQVKPVTINRKWDGKLFLENKFIYTNLKDCSFSWKAIKTGFGGLQDEVTGEGNLRAPDAQPGETVAIQVDCGAALEKADVFLFTATDHQGKELYTWSWPVIHPWEKAAELVATNQGEESEIAVQEKGNVVSSKVNGLEITFSKEDGTLLDVKNEKGTISLAGGPVPAGADSKVTQVAWKIDDEGCFRMDILTDNYPEKMSWTLTKNGLLKLEAAPLAQNRQNISFIGLSFNYPENKCTGVKWLGLGPYRVWKNRMKGSRFGVWEKAYNNTITGESFNKLIYPEFKGYHGKLYWLTLETTESPVTVISETPNLFFQLFKPEKPQHAVGGVYPPFPEGDLSFLYEIPAMGTKFKQPEKLGPSGRKGHFRGHEGDEGYPIVLWFDFRSE